MVDLPSSMPEPRSFLRKNCKDYKGRIPELDGLRGIGALAILFYHTWPTTFFFGWTRVDLFFVLSGYLITSILLKNQLSCRFLFVFWFRRALRIWPAYYLLLFILCVREILNNYSLNLKAVLSYVTFTQNVPYYWSGPILSFSSEATHTWALAIEEQFYLVWPLIMVIVGRRFLIPMVLWLIINSIVLRMFGFYPFVALARCDGLALGTILAICLENCKLSAQRSTWLHRAFVLTSLVALLFLVSFLVSLHGFLEETSQGSSLTIFMVSVFYCSIIGLVILHTGNPLLNFLRFRSLRYIGQISYGIYLYHLPIIDVITNDLKYGPIATQLAAISLSLLAGIISWECLERPLGRLKEKIPYEHDGTQFRAAMPYTEDALTKSVFANGSFL